jgi:antitoxin component YwqK of YwqJK toxin-antitoxin module
MKKKNSLYIICLIVLVLVSCTPKNNNIEEEYYPNGTIKTRMEVKDGKRNGLTQNYDNQGRLESTAELVDDIYEGWMTQYNPNTGKVSAKSYYVNDTQNGPAYQYYVTGELFREETYKEGRIDSIVKTFWANGKLQAEVYFRKGKPAVGLKEWNINGEPVEQPQIVIQKINHLEATSSVELKIYLSDNSKKVDFY